jgi:hypothetical protein
VRSVIILAAFSAHSLCGTALKGAPLVQHPQPSSPYQAALNLLTSCCSQACPLLVSLVACRSEGTQSCD